MSNLRTFDLNLLVAFDVLMRELNVTRAAEQMFITQSAMSHILQRLRQQLDDPLLVKTPTGMKPTERALALIEPVRGLLNEMEQLAPLIVAETDMILSLPYRIAEQFKKFAPLEIFPVPIDLPSYQLVMIWHPLHDKDLAHLWLRDKITAIGRNINGL